MDGAPMKERQRWPNWVYEEGDEPDYRFSFANERTYLAWIRTSLALLAAGVALDMIELSVPTGLQRGVAMLLVTLALISVVAAWARWAMAERAMRQARPLPAFGLGALFTLAMVATTVVLVAGGL